MKTRTNYFNSLIYSTIVCLIIFLSGCSGDDKVEDKNILGKWQLVEKEDELSGEITIIEDGDIYEYCSNGTGKIYTSDGTYKEKYSFEVGSGRLRKNLSSMWIECAYEISDNTLRMTSFGPTRFSPVFELTTYKRVE